ncbi:HAD family hydrolase [Georgenia sp. H159]|uniref:HAD family hydrolase n=1 Tax=Georgenia sp. H159 TaxID=3076115 RepID=UPI002D778AF3|nr:HAD family hydrolase [Georgenia sp. H159]
MPHHPRPAAFFDLDKTVIAGSSSFALSRAFYDGGLLTRSGALRGLYAQLGYLSFGADHDQTERMKDRLAQISRGWDVAHTEAVVAAALEQHIRPVVYREATELIDAHRAAGEDVVIVSASSEAVVRPIGELLGADHVIATRPVVADGRFTDELDFYAYGPTKATAMRELAREHGYDLAASHAYSDSVTDLPMLETVGHPVAVNPDRALRRHALAQGWQVRDFSRPVRLRPRRRYPAHVTLGLGAVAVGALGWRLVREARRTA